MQYGKIFSIKKRKFGSAKKAEKKVMKKEEPTQGKSCWRSGSSRGSATDLQNCKDTEEMGYNGCYPRCKQGYTGAGIICTQDCPSDFKNYAYYCEKPEGYWRGSGSVTQTPGSELFGFMYYPKCKPGYKAWGCCECRQECPSSMKDLTSMCLKDSY
mmetsp:Transcript_27289/g.36496  ORF Transcript_27289/g.36496 Transcript_27289/m.36496 type:complete len:156 (+) Transcript_27289:999-1466(+)